mmetsp:Transcript_15391/g.60155  ORF Transcript_15391/g.60155 Transcript_15391/m.60155 type:complete len:367 (-) Transcript_15391:1226-2326(-)
MEELDERLADIEHAALYCFDVLASRLVGKEEEPPLAFPEAKCGVYIQWRKYASADRSDCSTKPVPVGSNMVQLKPVSLHGHLLGMVAKTMAGAKGRKTIGLEDVAQLELTLTYVEPGSLRPMARHDEDWVQGRDGLVVSFEAPGADGALQRRATVFFPDYIEYYGWTLDEAVVQGIQRKHSGDITRAVVDSVRLQRFSTERLSVFFADYAKEREGSPLLDELCQAVRAARKQRRAGGSDGGKAKSDRKRKQEAECSFFWKFAAALAVVMALMVYLRYSQLTYSVDYEDFLQQYRVLGVEEGADMKTVKSAFRKLSRQWHPDKNPGCTECPEKYRLIAEAHKQISDYEKGILKLSTNVPLNSRFRPR